MSRTWEHSIDRGLEPAPERGRRTSWRTFLQSHLGAIAGAGFFTVEVLTPRRRDRNSPREHRRHHLPALRGIDEAERPFLRNTRYLILDRDPLYTRAFRQVLKQAGVEVVTLPARSPNLNAYAERFVRSVKSECLSRIIPLGERHLRHVLTQYAEHYHRERNHQGLGKRLVEPPPANTNAGVGAVLRRLRLGGLLSYYYRGAA